MNTQSLTYTIISQNVKVISFLYFTVTLLNLIVYGWSNSLILMVAGSPLLYLLATNLLGNNNLEKSLYHLSIPFLYLIFLGSGLISGVHSTITLPISFAMFYAILTITSLPSLHKSYTYCMEYLGYFQILTSVASAFYVLKIEDIIEFNFNIHLFVIGTLIFTTFYSLFLIIAIDKKEEREENGYSTIFKEEALVLVPEVYETQVEKLKNYFRTEDCYLKPNFCLEQLAQNMDMEKQELTFLLNHVLKTNFYALLAEERIKVAKRLLYEYTDKYTIEYIMQAVGFRSKSSFNKHFKQFTGYTPSLYREKLMNAELYNRSDV